MPGEGPNPLTQDQPGQQPQIDALDDTGRDLAAYGAVARKP